MMIMLIVNSNENSVDDVNVNVDNSKTKQSRVNLRQ